MTSRLLLNTTHQTLPLLCRPVCHPGQLAVRDSHVISVCQTNDLRLGCLPYWASHTLHGWCHFRPTMFHRLAYPPNTIINKSPCTRAHPRFLHSSGTHTRRYTLKLSKDLTISGECRSVQVSPRDPAPFLVLLHTIAVCFDNSSFRARLISLRAKSTGYAVLFPNVPCHGFTPFHTEQGQASHLATRVRVAQLLFESASSSMSGPCLRD